MLADALTKALVHCPSLLSAMNARFQHKCEDNSADALRACANSQNGDWISADTISRTAIWKTWSEHSLNPLENAVCEIGICVSSMSDFNIITVGHTRTFEQPILRTRFF